MLVVTCELQSHMFGAVVTSILDLMPQAIEQYGSMRMKMMV